MSAASGKKVDRGREADGADYDLLIFGPVPHGSSSGGY
mgnify:CR=1 FL=1